MKKNEIKHLEFIQNVISRLNSNSYQIKNWAVTIIAADLALYASTLKADFILIGVIPTVIFWLWDAYCLTQERRFRALYNDVACISKNPKLLKPFEMNSNIYSKGECGYWNVLTSKTILLSYMLIIFFLIVFFLIVKI